MNNQVYSSGDGPDTTALAEATKLALNRQGANVEEPTPPSASDLRQNLIQLQKEIGRLTVVPTTHKAVEEYDLGLQQLALQVTPQIGGMEAFLQTVKDRELQEEPAFVEQVKTTEKLLADIKNQPALRRYIDQAKKFLVLTSVRGFSALREILEGFVEENLVFRAKKDPRLDSPKIEGFLREMEVILFRDNGAESYYEPHRQSFIAQFCWGMVETAHQQVRQAWSKRRQTIGVDLETFKAKDTQGLNVYKAEHEEAEGLIFRETSFEDRKTGRPRSARILIRVGHGNFTVWEVFGPDGIDFILSQSRFPDGNIRWFPIYSGRFDPERAPPAITDIVWPALHGIPPVELIDDRPGICTAFIQRARTHQRGPVDLVLRARGTGNGTFILEQYFPKWVFDFEAILGQEFSFEETEEEEVSSEWRKFAVQARIVRGFLQLAANRQLSAEIQTKREDPELHKLLITVTEGLAGKTGHSIFHVPQARTNSHGPAPTTCHIEWQKNGYRLQEYVSWVEPWERSRGPLKLNVIGVIIPRQPAEDEEPVIQGFRHLLAERKGYEAWKASQGKSPEETEEGENGPPSNNKS